VLSRPLPLFGGELAQAFDEERALADIALERYTLPGASHDCLGGMADLTPEFLREHVRVTV
jgi:hypothetical protein